MAPMAISNSDASSNSSPTQATSKSTALSSVSTGLLLIRILEAQGLKMRPEVASDKTMKKEDKLPYCVIEFDKQEIAVPAKDGDLDGKSITWQHRANFDVSIDSEAIISLYQRASPTAATSTNASKLAGSGGDIFLGSIRVKPTLKDQALTDEWYTLQSAAGEDAHAGKVHVQLVFKSNGPTKKAIGIDDFELLKVIGKGSFGKVMQVRKKDTGRIYAMKIIRKQHIVERAEVQHTLAERNVLSQLFNPFVVNLKWAFQTPEKLYFVLAFVNGGELFHHLQREGRFSEDRGRFYTAELLTALECLHKFDVIYRDLKPENILLDYTGHIALCDFGLCKLNIGDKQKTNTFCGTPEYLAPELLIGNGYTKAVDWWTLGVLLYEMLTGLPPFYDENTNEMYKKILTAELVLTDDMGREAKDLLKQLLNRDSNQRLGANGADEIKRHPFFAGIDWNKLHHKKYQPPYKPTVLSAADTSNFDEVFTSEQPTDSVVADSHLSTSVQQQFQGFTYQATNEHLGASVSQSVMGQSVLSSTLGGRAAPAVPRVKR
ncbi:hypothetical protein HDU93_005264 [Gonapodya sp. JEL0774]|nr:hypothetical protein HDU93_005264 [Gonapodya sp. JEL0774]